jgi:hypothetical protein
MPSHPRLTHCPHCRAEVDAAAKKCRYCGKSVTHPQSKREARLKGERRWAGWVMAGFFVATLVAVSLISRSRPQSPGGLSSSVDSTSVEKFE